MEALIIIVCVVVLALVLVGIAQYAISLARRASSLKEKGAFEKKAEEDKAATKKPTNG